MPSTQRQSVRTAITTTVVIVLAAFSLLPIANWIPGGHEAPWYAAVADGWLGGTMLVVGIGALLALASQRMPRLWWPGAADGLVEAWRDHPRHGTITISLAALTAYLLMALVAFDGRPLLIDEVPQLLHARAFTEGMLAWPTREHPEFFSSLHVIDAGGRSYSHFPPGGPAMLALGVLVDAAWLVVPLCGAIAVAVFASIARRTAPGPGVSLAATLLFAFAPFMVFMSGTHMNHVPALMWILVGAAGLLRVTASTTAVPWVAFASGLGFGAAATIRPGDALAFALPAAAWHLALAFRDRRRWADAVASGLGVAIPIAALMWVNLRTTGSPTLLAYEVLWGGSVNLGFHAGPWGGTHTPTRGLELLNGYLLRLGTVLYEFPLPSVLPAIVALALARRLDGPNRYMLASSGLLLAVYFAYWHNGTYPVPRFMIPMLPVFAIWTARFLPEVRDRLGESRAYRAAVYAAVTTIVIAVGLIIPARVREQAASSPSMRQDLAAAADSAGVRDALILVHESWGMQLLARLWARDIPHADARRLHEFVDRCLLDDRLVTLERDEVRGPAALAALRPLMRDSSRVTATVAFGYRNEVRLPGLRYSDRCMRRIAGDRAGTFNINAVLLERGSNIYARDLEARDSLLLHAFPDRPVYLLRPSSGVVGSPPRFIPLSRDSLWVAWTGHADPALASATGEPSTHSVRTGHSRSPSSASR